MAVGSKLLTHTSCGLHTIPGRVDDYILLEVNFKNPCSTLHGDFSGKDTFIPQPRKSSLQTAVMVQRSNNNVFFLNY